MPVTRTLLTTLAAALAVPVLLSASPASTSAGHHPYKLAGHATTAGSPEYITIRMRGCARPPVVHAESADSMAENFTVTHRSQGRNRYTGLMIFYPEDETGTWHITTAACHGRDGRTHRITFPHPVFTVTPG